MKKQLLTMLSVSFLLICFSACEKTVVDEPEVIQTIGFESVALGTEGYLNQTSFAEGGMTFENNYSAEYQAWKGFACSAMTDTLTAIYTNDLSAITGAAYGGTNYAVVYADSATCKFTDGQAHKIKGFYVTNTTYTYYTVLDGNSWSMPFSANSWYKLIIKGYASNQLVGTAEFYLADYRDNQSLIIKDWTFVSLEGSISEAVTRLEFYFDSTDKGAYGVNTPTYVCIDNISFVQ